MAAIIPVTPAVNASSISVSECETIEAEQPTSNSLLSNIFFIRKKEYSVSLCGGKLVWERSRTKRDRNIVSVTNILSINFNSSVKTERASKEFTIFYAKRIENSSDANKWRQFSQTFQNNDSQVCQTWIQIIQRQIDEQVARPKRLLLFVNPYGGKKRALRIYDSMVKPIFQSAGIDASVVISQRPNQIRDFIMTQSLEHFDGIVCIGGDGTFSELFNGIIFRTFKDLGYENFSNLDEIPKINEKPLGIIPAGSTDTVAYCLNGTCDVRTITITIALGFVNGLDLSSVSNQNGSLLKFYASVMSYGFLGDVAIESEKFRWMGPKRYDYSGFKKLLLNRGYDGEVSMVVDPFAGDPLKGPACLEKCSVCGAKSEPIQIQTNQSTVIKSTTENVGDKFDNNNEQILRNHDEHSIHIDIHVRNTRNNTTENTDDVQYVKTINGKFFMVNGANISCACPRSPNGFSKYCHLCDGYIDLVLVRKTSFLNNLRFLLAMSNRNCKITDLDHVEIYRTKKFSFKPIGLQTGVSAFNLHSSRVPINCSNGSTQSSVWNCDGEVIHDSEVSVRSHRHLISVYRREMFNAQKEGVRKSICCC